MTNYHNISAMKATGAMISGKQAYDAEKIREAARAIGKHASEAVELFPNTEESRNPQTALRGSLGAV